jgi:integrase
LRLRVKDIDFNLGCIQVQDGKGNKHRTTLLPQRLIPDIQNLIQQAIALQQSDNQQGVGPSLPFALDKKYPSAYRQPAWMFIFLSTTLCAHPVSGRNLREHLAHLIGYSQREQVVTSYK